MATPKKSTRATEAPVEPDSVEPDEVPAEEQPPEPEEEPEVAVNDSGFVLVRATSAGFLGVPSGATFSLSPGHTYSVSKEDAEYLVKNGVAVPAS